MASRFVPADKLHISPPPSRRHGSVGRHAAATDPSTAAAAAAASDAAAPAAAVSRGRCSQWGGGRRRGARVMAAERCTVEQKLRGRRLGRCVHRGRSRSGERQQLILRALPSSRADRRGGRGARRMDSLRSRQKGHDNFPCTHFRVVVASLFHDESHLPRNIISESSSRSFETAPRQKNLQK